MSIIDGKTILVTGGTGTFGKAFIKHVFENHNPKKLIVFSRDEFKQYQLEKMYPMDKYSIRYFIGDIRDKDRLYRAFNGVDYVIHAAALKQVPACEYNPFEAVRTNVLGAQNIIDAAIDRGVKKVIAISTDKAVNPINLYGGTKMVMEKLMVAGNYYVGGKGTVFAAVRYGNVVGSRGSVIPLFRKFKEDGIKKLPITDERMTRFWIPIEDGVKLVMNALEEAVGGETFVPRIPSMKITDLARAIIPDCEFEQIGIRPGEKLHETLISEEEGDKICKLTRDRQDMYVILPHLSDLEGRYSKYADLEEIPSDFTYKSSTNDEWLSVSDINQMINH
jgi:UDP-N-acetylglucosamine 4,6-dehydratase